jgi:hypothetical protein
VVALVAAAAVGDGGEGNGHWSGTRDQFGGMEKEVLTHLKLHAIDFG